MLLSSCMIKFLKQKLAKVNFSTAIVVYFKYRHDRGICIVYCIRFNTVAMAQTFPKNQPRQREAKPTF